MDGIANTPVQNKSQCFSFTVRDPRSISSQSLSKLPYFASVRDQTTRWTTQESPPMPDNGLSLLKTLQTSPGAHPAFYSIRTGGWYPRGVNRSGREADNSRPSSRETNNALNYTSILPYAFTEWRNRAAACSSDENWTSYLNRETRDSVNEKKNFCGI